MESKQLKTEALIAFSSGTKQQNKQERDIT
jgi:hypothetical protein